MFLVRRSFWVIVLIVSAFFTFGILPNVMAISGNKHGVFWNMRVSNVGWNSYETHSNHRVDIINNSAHNTTSVFWEFTHRIIEYDPETGTLEGPPFTFINKMTGTPIVYKKNHPTGDNEFTRSARMGIDGFETIDDGWYKIYAYTLLNVKVPAGTVVNRKTDHWTGQFWIGGD